MTVAAMVPEASAIRYRLLVAAAVLLLGAPSAASAQWVLGMQGGIAAFTMAGEAPEGASYGRQKRAAVSAVLGYRIAPSVVLRVEPGFVQRGAGVSYDLEGREDPVDSLSVNLNYLSMPVVMQVVSAGGRGFVTAGLELGTLSKAVVTGANGGAETDVKGRLEGRDVAWIFGVGGLVRRSEPQLSLELRYVQSLVTAFEESSGDAGLPRALRSNGLSLLAGISWGPGGGR